MNLDKCRQEIDTIDRELACLFEKRMKVVGNVALYKKENDLPILNTAREQEVLQKNVAFINHFPLKTYAYSFFDFLISLSKNYQKTLINTALILDFKKGPIGFQGIKGAYSYEASEIIFGSEFEKQSFTEFEDLAIAIEDGTITFGVFPIENSTAGIVSPVYEILNKTNLIIVCEKTLSINHQLLGISNTSIEDLRDVYSHPQALKQCASFLKKHPHIKIHEMSNTALAAQKIAQENNSTQGAIASKRAGEFYNLSTISSNINDFEGNQTRFVVLAKNPITCELPNKRSLKLRFRDAKNLSSVVKVLDEYNLKIIKWVSSPIPQSPWESYTYIDCLGIVDNWDSVWGKIQDHTYEAYFLGAYQDDGVQV